jgi:putative nucleotidyltransferase with HDIG domain
MPLGLLALVLLGCVEYAERGVGAEPQSAAPAPPRAATRSLALKELQAREPDPARIAHALAVEASMRELARRLNGEAEEWGLAGLLHDIDLAETRANPSQHGVVGARLIVELGFSAAIGQAVAAHDDGAGVPRRAPMDHALYCADRAFWAIRSSGVDIGGGVESATPDSVIAGLAKKGIANRIDTGLEKACAALGLTINELLSISLSAMRASPIAAVPRPRG